MITGACVVIHHETGEIIAEFPLDDAKDYQVKKEKTRS